MSMQCPGCGSSMGEQRYENELIDLCGSCGGVWLDDGEVASIVRDTGAVFSEADKIEAVQMKGQDHRQSDHQVSCPKCRSALETIQYAVTSGVFIDRCPNQHGLWLDHGELDKIQIVMEQSSLRSGTHNRQSEAHAKGTKCCPRDGGTLSEVRYETEKVDQCGECGGIWADNEELVAIVQSRMVQFGDSDHSDIQAKEDLTRVSTEEEIVIDLDCIVCSKPMKRLNYSYNSGIIVDRCIDGHGVWMDHHELERIQVFAERWQAQSHQLGQKYANVLKTAQAEARASYERSVAQGKMKGQKASVLGSFLKKVGL